MLILTLSSCCRFSNKDFEFADSYARLIKSYHKANDTLIFKSDSGDLDTFMINSINTTQSCAMILGYPHRGMNISITHLPKNNWIGGTQLNEGSKLDTINQALISITKIPMLEENPYSVVFKYRDFEIVMDSIPDYKLGFEFGSLKLDSCLLLDTELPIDLQNGNSVIQIVWTDKVGLIAYKKKNGEIYRYEK